MQSLSDFLPKLLHWHFDYKTLGKLLVHGGGPNFPYKNSSKWTSDHLPFAMQMSVIYMVVIFSIQRAMRHCPAFSLRLPLAVWNLFLALISILMAYKFIKEFLTFHFTNGMMHGMCYSGDFMKGANGYFVFVFVVSKLFEMVDTLFIVLRKRPLIFLHWFHHIVTFVYVVWAYPQNPSGNRYGFVFNAIAHSVMYSYYFLRTVDFPLPKWVSKSVTLLQITQFVASLFFYPLLAVLVYVYELKTCDFKWNVFWWGVAMNVAYLILFLQYYRNAYNLSARRYDSLDGLPKRPREQPKVPIPVKGKRD
ncbi:hypothetical protein WR25_12094 [Diploscapter pachys]|uniref:Elongation of very long chain fatty acids protein n=1 Tax=Diploscapter pachys TaxID=2018661 RepID=A0A2A2JH56_9BILA|nr:hypothetical protein WR25_12094 [Diploscapter pachys]